MTSRSSVVRQPVRWPLPSRPPHPPGPPHSSRTQPATPPQQLQQPAAQQPVTRLMPRVQFNTPIPRASKQLSYSQSAAASHGSGSGGSSPHHALLIASPSASSPDSSRAPPPLSASLSRSSSSSSLLEDGKDKRRRSAWPVFATAAGMACVLLVILLAGMYLPRGNPLILMPHPPTLALLRDRETHAATTPPSLQSALTLSHSLSPPMPAEAPAAVEDSTAGKAGAVHRLKQRVSDQQADSVQTIPRPLQPNALHTPQPVPTEASSPVDSTQKQPPLQRLQLPLPAPPLALLPYYERNMSGVATFHNAFFNEPYMRDRNVPLADRGLLASNRALPHSFPAPPPFVPALLSSSVVVGVFCYNVARIEVLLDTWGKWMLPAHLMIFSEPNSDPAAQRRQQSLPSVIIMSNDANQHRNVTDRRASAWKILPAVRLMRARHPHSPWYYLCDDDSFPIVPNLAHFTANFYSAYPAYTPQHAMYVGESVLQQTFYKGFYADEKVQAQTHTHTHAHGRARHRDVPCANEDLTAKPSDPPVYLPVLFCFPVVSLLFRPAHHGFFLSRRVMCGCVVLCDTGYAGRPPLSLHGRWRAAESAHDVSAGATRGQLLRVLCVGPVAGPLHPAARAQRDDDRDTGRHAHVQPHGGGGGEEVRAARGGGVDGWGLPSHARAVHQQVGGWTPG